MILYVLVFIAVIVREQTRAFDPDAMFALAIVVPLALLLLGLVAHWIARRRARRALVNAGSICSRCNYSMRGLDETIPNCPECGHPRRLLSKNSQGNRAHTF